MDIKKTSEFIEDENQKKICIHPEHNPPTHLYIPMGTKYRHVCPHCGREIIIRPLDIIN